jgi:hypothetical protein
MITACLSRIQAFMALTQMLVMPLFFPAGVLYPMKRLPGWRIVPVEPGRIRSPPSPARRFAHLT